MNTQMMIEKPIIIGLLIFLIIKGSLYICKCKHQLFRDESGIPEIPNQTETSIPMSGMPETPEIPMSGIAEIPNQTETSPMSGMQEPPEIPYISMPETPETPETPECDCDLDTQNQNCVYYTTNGTQQDYDPDNKDPFIEYCFNKNPDETPITGPAMCPDADANGNKFNYPFKDVVCDEGVYVFSPTLCRYYSLEANDEKKGPITMNDLQTAKESIVYCFKQQTITGNNATCAKTLPAKVDHQLKGYRVDRPYTLNDMDERESLNYKLTNVTGSEMEFDVIDNNGTLPYHGYCLNNVLLLVPDGDDKNWYSVLAASHIRADTGAHCAALGGRMYHWEAGSWKHQKYEQEEGFCLA